MKKIYKKELNINDIKLFLMVYVLFFGVLLYFFNICLYILLLFLWYYVNVCWCKKDLFDIVV